MDKKRVNAHWISYVFKAVTGLVVVIIMGWFFYQNQQPPDWVVGIFIAIVSLVWGLEAMAKSVLSDNEERK